MCSIGEEDFGDDGAAHTMIKDIESLEIVEEICKKCLKEKSAIKIGFKDEMCVSCFIYYARHKFRATLGSTKIIPRGSNVLMNFSASHVDVCLLDMIKFGYEGEVHRRLYFNTTVIYIDENCIKISDIDERFNKIQELRKNLEQFKNFKCYYSSIADKDKVMLIDEVKIVDLKELAEEESKFVKLINSLESLTSKQDFLVNIRNNNLRHIAVTHLNCKFIFLTDATIDLAKRLIENMALGRGSSVAHDVAFCDDRIESVRLLRPMKDLAKNEIESYVKFKNLNVIEGDNFGIDAGQFASIQNMTSQFIDGLQENFSSTISTIFRGCGKIASLQQSAAVDINQRCRLCKSFLDYQNSNTLFAIEFSRYVSEAAANSEKLIQNAESIEEKAMNAVKSVDSKLKQNLCHGCRNIFIGLDEDEIKEIF